MQITIDLTDYEVKCLNNDLLDINQWAQEAIKGKISKCKGRMLAEWQPKLLADPEVTSLPATEEGLIDLIIARPDYKNRAARDAEVQQI